MEKPLTPKQKRFVEEYLADKELNATKAAINAGYSEKTARQQGARLLTNVDIQNAIQEAQNKRSERVEITQDDVLKELIKLGFSNMLDYVQVSSDGLAYVDLSTLTREQAAAIQEITVDEYTEGKGEGARDVKKVKVKLADKKSALELIGKHLTMFKDRVEHTGKDGEPIGVKVIVEYADDTTETSPPA